MGKKQEKIRKGDPERQYDVIVSVIHDDRKGFAKPVEKPARYSFATEEEALNMARQLKEIAQNG